MISSNIVVGSVAAGATTGALMAAGHRAGSVRLPFAAIGAVLFHRAPSATAFGLVMAGLVLHIAMTFAWSAVFAWIVQWEARRDLIAACGVAIAQLAVSWAVASLTGTGLASVLPLGDRIVVALVMGGALVAGMRFARPVSRIA